MKKNFIKALNTGRFALVNGFRKLNAKQHRECERYLAECYNWLAKNNPTDAQVKEFVQKHKEWILLIVPGNKAGNSLKQKLFSA